MILRPLTCYEWATKGRLEFLVFGLSILTGGDHWLRPGCSGTLAYLMTLTLVESSLASDCLFMASLLYLPGLLLPYLGWPTAELVDIDGW